MNRQDPPVDPHAATLVEAGACMARGDLARAAVALDRVLAAAPDHPGALFQRAVIEVAGNRPGPAAALLARCVAAQPGWAEAWIRLGQLRLMLGEHQAAAQALREATARAPTDLRAAEGLAEALRRCGDDFAALVAARRRLVELEPREVEHWLRLGYTLRSGDLGEQAEAAYRGALVIDSQQMVARWSLFQNPTTVVPASEAEYLGFAARWSEGLAWFESLDIARAAPPAIEQALLTATDFALHYQPGPLRAERSRYADALSRLARAAIPAPRARPRPPGSRRRIALVSASFRRHSVTKVLGGLVDALDPQRFEVGLFHLDPRRDALTEHFSAQAARYFGGNHRPAAWLEQVAAFGPDAVVYLDLGMDPLSQVLACYRLAPLQLVLWGHPLTSGQAAIDGFVSADHTEAADPSPHYREAVHRLPNLGTCYRPPARAPRTVRDDGCVHFLLAQMVMKITPHHDAALARIARELPTARFTIAASPRAHVRDALAARIRRAFEVQGVDFTRHVTMAPHLSEPAFLAKAASMDVNLDTVGWSGGVSTLDLLAQDLPTVAVDVPTLRGRQSAAMLRHAGVPELVCTDLDGWVARALELGRDRALREHLRERIAAGSVRLYDDPAPPAAFVALLERLVPTP
jgi:protein O-GlcNAc transferase